jgi:predicted Ser/Thr protein kinase
MNVPDPEVTIERPDKGLVMRFFPTCVIKDYQTAPTGTLVSGDEQLERFKGELQAYRRFNELKCPFTPELIEVSEEDKYLSIARIHGDTLLNLTQKQDSLLDMKLITQQLDTINAWLRENSFPDMGNNTKYFIVSNNQLYMVDFEGYRPGAPINKNADIYNDILRDILDRMIIRQGRKARMTKPFRHMALSFFRRRPRKAISTVIRCFCKKAKLIVSKFCI